MIARILLGCLLLAAPSAALAKKKDQGPSAFEQMNLAKVMLQDGHFDRALLVLRQVDPTAEGVEGVDPMEHARLLGLAHYKLDQFEGAAKAYAEAIRLGDVTPNVHIQRVIALLKLDRPEDALAGLRAAPDTVNDAPARYILESNARYALGDKHGAFSALDRGHQRLPDNALIARKRVLMLVDLGLYQTAVDEAQAIFSRADATVEDFLGLSTALVEAGEKKRASLLLEQATLLFPEDIELRTRLALAYHEQNLPLAAGDILYPVALIEPERAQGAAELYLKARRYTRAERMNAKVADQAQKVRQRLIILLEQNHFEAAASLDDRLSRLGLLEDENIAYALAYAHYRVANFDRMEALLSLIRDSGLFRKANELRRSAEQCRQSVWKCD